MRSLLSNKTAHISNVEIWCRCWIDENRTRLQMVLFVIRRVRRCQFFSQSWKCEVKYEPRQTSDEKTQHRFVSRVTIVVYEKRQLVKLQFFGQ